MDQEMKQNITQFIDTHISNTLARNKFQFSFKAHILNAYTHFKYIHTYTHTHFNNPENKTGTRHEPILLRNGILRDLL